ncbi:M48 family metalloprotease [Qipengyuania sp. S6317L1]|uniref:M48 family metallopeptidase n=1 Tax=Qipengyuania sp. S6317L1 TaxID=2926410 RepID=UPI001FF4DB64|nr:M48 family metallopeptidase [Qipengyuania sp. S6317L1]MCK0099773.1 M48 family metalloprotease [Qipengyuania sp. S6317L1]
MSAKLLKAFAGIILCAVGITSAQGHNDVAPLPPPYAGHYQPEGRDEVGLWQLDDENERRLANAPILIRDEALTDYVHEILCRTVGDDRCGSIRTYIIREPTFNATMSPNGTMRVFSGLLLRMRSEAELAAILGHEFGHFEKRHSLNGFRSRRRGTDILAWSALLVSAAPSQQGFRNHQNLELSVYGELFSYKRNQEREADLLGLGYLNASEYRPQSASEVWTNLMGEIEASARVRGKRKPNFKRVAFTASHPPQGERAAYLKALADPQGYNRDDGALRYREMLAPFLSLFLEDQVRHNDFGATQYILNSLGDLGWNADLYFAQGEMYRSRGNQRDFANAIESFEAALELDSTMAAAYRGLGLCLIRAGDRSRGREALKSYLELAPEAEDSAMILMMIG